MVFRFLLVHVANVPRCRGRYGVPRPEMLRRISDDGAAVVGTPERPIKEH